MIIGFLIILIFNGLLLLNGEIEAKTITIREAAVLAVKNNFDMKIEQSSVEQNGGAYTKSLGEFDFTLDLSTSIVDSESPSSSSLDGVSPATAIVSKSKTYEASLSKKFKFGTELSLPYSYTIEESNSSYSLIPETHETSFGFTITQPVLLTFFPSYFTKDIKKSQIEWDMAKDKYGQKMQETIMK